MDERRAWWGRIMDSRGPQLGPSHSRSAWKRGTRGAKRCVGYRGRGSSRGTSLREPGPVDNSATGVTGHPPRIRRANTTNEYSHAATREQNFVFRRYFIVPPTRTSSRTSFLTNRETLYSNLTKLTKLIFTDEETKNRGYLWFCISFEDDYSSIDLVETGEWIFISRGCEDNFFALHQLGIILARFF